jgi:hypothetical protein
MVKVAGWIVCGKKARPTQGWPLNPTGAPPGQSLLTPQERVETRKLHNSELNKVCALGLASLPSRWKELTRLKVLGMRTVAPHCKFRIPRSAPPF